MAGAENKVTVQEKGDRPPWDMTWLPSLPALWESQRALRQRSISGKPLVTGIMSRRHGVEVCVGSMACVKLNHEVLKPITSAMAESACLQTPGLELLFHEVLAFHVSAGYPDEKQMAAVAHADAWGLKRMLNFLRRKWYKEETPRVPQWHFDSPVKQTDQALCGNPRLKNFIASSHIHAAMQLNCHFVHTGSLPLMLKDLFCPLSTEKVTCMVWACT